MQPYLVYTRLGTVLSLDLFRADSSYCARSSFKCQVGLAGNIIIDSNIRHKSLKIAIMFTVRIHFIRKNLRKRHIAILLVI